MCQHKLGMERLDTAVARRLDISRSAAKALIIQGEVSLNGLCIDKPSVVVLEQDLLECARPRFVGRGGHKLMSVIEAFGINIDGRVCLDVGSSTGGFTDCMIQNGARLVHAIDVGDKQLHESLRGRSDVCLRENTNILDVEVLSPVPSFATVDVSFVSVTKLLSHICGLIDKDYDISMVVLVKPQFECGPGSVSKRGIVRDDKTRMAAVDKVAGVLTSLLRRQPKHIAHSPVPTGNMEYLIVI